MGEAEELKMWLAVRSDLGMPAGKLATQAGHGYSQCLLKAEREMPELVRDYEAGACPKITVVVSNEAALRRVEKEALDSGIFAAFIIDAGRTIFSEPTPTVCAFGPFLRSELPPFLRRLRLMDEFASPPVSAEDGEER